MSSPRRRKRTATTKASERGSRSYELAAHTTAQRWRVRSCSQIYIWCNREVEMAARGRGCCWRKKERRELFSLYIIFSTHSRGH